MSTPGLFRPVTRRLDQTVTCTSPTLINSRSGQMDPDPAVQRDASSSLSGRRSLKDRIDSADALMVSSSLLSVLSILPGCRLERSYGSSFQHGCLKSNYKDLRRGPVTTHLDRNRARCQHGPKARFHTLITSSRRHTGSPADPPGQ